MRVLSGAQTACIPLNPEGVNTFFVPNCQQAIGVAYQFVRYLDGGAVEIGKDAFCASSLTIVQNGDPRRVRCRDGVFKIDRRHPADLTYVDVNTPYPGYFDSTGASRFIEARCIMGKLVDDNTLEIYPSMPLSSLTIGSFPALAAGVSFLLSGGCGDAALAIAIRRSTTPIGLLFVNRYGVQEALFTREGRSIFAIKGGVDTFSNSFAIGLDNDPYLLSIANATDIEFDIFTEAGGADGLNWLSIEVR